MRVVRCLACLVVCVTWGCSGDQEPAPPGTVATPESVASTEAPGPSEVTFDLMTYNMLVGTEPSHVAEVVEAASPDVIVIQEATLAKEAVAAELRLEVAEVGEGPRKVIILSRLPITEVLGSGIRLELCAGVEVAVFGVHLEPYPYEPYDLRDDPDLTEDQLIESARTTRGAQLDLVLDELAPLVGEMPVFLGGDFNEPSHLDWTPDAAAAGLHFSRAVAWPGSTEAAERGLVDSYRAVEPDSVRSPGDTWTPQSSEGEVHDRIDRLYHSADASVDAVQIVGESRETSDLVIDPYVSDHRAVLARYTIPATCSDT